MANNHLENPSLNLRTVQVLLWDLMSPKISPVERDEVELVLGRLVEDNNSLFEEANMLGTILEDLEGEIHESWLRRKLIDTPARAMLERDLRKMLGTLKFSMGSSSLSSKEKQIYEYLQSTKTDGIPLSGSQSRPFTPRSMVMSRPASSCSTSSRPSTAGSTDSFSQIALPDVYKVLQQVESKLNVYDIDTIAPTLKQVLQAEHEALLEDIEYLQQCLQDKSGERTATVAPPSMKELKDFGKTLQGVSQVDKLLDVSNRPLHGGALEEESSELPNDGISSLTRDPLMHLPRQLEALRVPKAPPKPLAKGSGKPPSSRARKLRGMISQSREN